MAWNTSASVLYFTEISKILTSSIVLTVHPVLLKTPMNLTLQNSVTRERASLYPPASSRIYRLRFHSVILALRALTGSQLTFISSLVCHSLHVSGPTRYTPPVLPIWNPLVYSSLCQFYISTAISYHYLALTCTDNVLFFTSKTKFFKSSD